MRVVFDTNVLVSATIVNGKQFELLRLAKLGEIKLVLSFQIIEEFIENSCNKVINSQEFSKGQFSKTGKRIVHKEVISREKFGFSEKQVENAVKEILDIAEIIYSVSKFDIIKEDSDDNRVLECAVDGSVDYIVSGDSHLLGLGNFKGIRIVNGDEFLKILER